MKKIKNILYILFFSIFLFGFTTKVKALSDYYYSLQFGAETSRTITPDQKYLSYKFSTNTKKDLTLSILTSNPENFKGISITSVIKICSTADLIAGDYKADNNVWSATIVNTDTSCKAGNYNGKIIQIKVIYTAVVVANTQSGASGYLGSVYPVLSSSVPYSANNVSVQFLSVNSYFTGSLEEQTVESNNTIIEQNQEAEQTRKGILETIRSVLSGITNLPGLIWNAIKGGFEAITKGLTNMLDFIKTLPGLIWDAIKGGFEAITNALISLGNFIIDGLKSLFIPENDFFSNYFQELYNFFTVKFGILLYPVDLLLDVLGRFLDLPPTSSGLVHIPNISIGEYGILIEQRDFYINEYWSQEPYKKIYDIYKIFVNAFVGFCLINLAVKKEKEMRGVSD